MYNTDMGTKEMKFDTLHEMANQERILLLNRALAS